MNTSEVLFVRCSQYSTLLSQTLADSHPHPFYPLFHHTWKPLSATVEVQLDCVDVCEDFCGLSWLAPGWAFWPSKGKKGKKLSNKRRLKWHDRNMVKVSWRQETKRFEQSLSSQLKHMVICGMCFRMCRVFAAAAQEGANALRVAGQGPSSRATIVHVKRAVWRPRGISGPFDEYQGRVDPDRHGSGRRWRRWGSESHS